jgi:predicted phage tail protein
MNEELRNMQQQLYVTNEQITSLKATVNELKTSLVEAKNQLIAKANQSDLLQMQKMIENKNMPLTDVSSEEHEWNAKSIKNNELTFKAKH